MRSTRWLPAALAFSFLTIPLPDTASAKKPELPSVRWVAGAPGCSFTQGDDGRFRWTMSDENLDITLLVDSQELTKSRRRFYHVFGLYLSVSYKGSGKFEFPADLRLEFARHHNIVEGYLDPTELQTHLQNDLDTQVFETEREIKKNPAIKDQKTALLQQYQKEGAEFIEFLTSQYLEPATLNPGNQEAHGWVFFSTSNKWIGPWKQREDFVLSVWMKDRIWQFPFSLPPSGAEILLRKPPD